MDTHKAPKMPTSLQGAWDGNPQLAKMHAILQQAPTMYAPGIDRWGGSQNRVRAIDLPHGDMADGKTAIVVPFPYATGYLPHMAARMAMIQAAAPEPTRLIALPNSTADKPAMDLTRKERSVIAGGDFTPYNERVLRTLETMGVEKIHMVGYSQGAAVGAHLMALASQKGTIAVGDAGIFEAPNLTRKNPLALAKSFAQVGMSAVFDAMEAAEVPLLRESLKGEPFYRGPLNMTSADNLAMARGMARHPLTGDVWAVAEYAPDASLTFMRGETSNITPAAPFNRLTRDFADHFPGRSQVIEVAGAGHGVGDNVAVHGVLASLTLANIAI